jgi:cobalt-zinc-cadmium efflux system outer membrane protein
MSGYQHRRLALEAARYGALRVVATTARDSALHTLRTLIGWADSAPTRAFTVPEPAMPAPLGETADSLVTLALAQRPELSAARFDALTSAAEADLIAAGRVPTPTLSGGLKRERRATGEVADGFVAGITLPVPLWDRRGGAMDAARAETARSEAEVETLRRLTEREVRIAFAAHQALQEQLGLLTTQLGQSAVLARQAAEAAYSEGEIGLVEWLDMVRAYQDAETMYTSLWAEYIARRAALERATGALLF